MTTPPRSAVGCASAAIEGPTTSGQARCTSASSVCGASSSASTAEGRLHRARRAAVDASSRRPPWPRRAPRRRRPPAAVTPGSSAPGTCSRSVAVITDWPSPARSRSTSARRRSRSSSLITSSSSISGGLWRCGGQRLALGQQQRQQRQPLLALGAVGAQLAALARGDEVVAVGPVAGEAALEVAVDALAQLRGELLRRRRLRSRPVAQRGLAVQARGRRTSRANGLARSRRRAALAVAPSARARGAPAARPSCAASSRLPAPERIRAISALRWARDWA